MNIGKDRILKEVRVAAGHLIRYSEGAQWVSFLGCYIETPDFLAISADSMIRNYTDFKKVCKDYYESLKKQKLAITHEIFHVLGEDTVV